VSGIYGLSEGRPTSAAACSPALLCRYQLLDAGPWIEVVAALFAVSSVAFPGSRILIGVTLVGKLLFRVRCQMANSKELAERARIFEERAEKATDPISRQHYREMAAHYRALSVEHQDVPQEAGR
jgi:hypothetical protein